MDSGLAAARRPGMTAVRSSGPGGYAIAASEVSIAVRYPEMPGQHRASKDERPRCAEGSIRAVALRGSHAAKLAQAAETCLRCSHLRVTVRETEPGSPTRGDGEG